MQKLSHCSQQYLGIVFGVPSMQRNSLEIETAVKVDRCDDVSLEDAIKPR